MTMTSNGRPKRLFNGYWNPERRRLRMTKEQGTLPSMCNSAVLAPGGAGEAFAATTVLLAAFAAFTRLLARL